MRVRFLLHKTFGLERDTYEVNDVSEDITLIEFVRRLSKELGSELMQKMVTESGGRGLLILVNGTAVNDLNTTFKSIKASLRGSKGLEITITPFLEGG